MPELPDTRPSLLLRVQGREVDAWSEFLELYRPTIYRTVRRRGWQDADAQDITQIVLVKISNSIHKFDLEGHARFRTWLMTICRNTLVDELRRQRARIPLADSQPSPSEPAVEDIGESELLNEYRRQVFRTAAEKCRNEFTDKTWLAFWETAVLGTPPSQTAAKLDLSVGAIYTAKSRVMQRLKQWVLEIDDENL